jgi:hypothetical protein
MAPWVRELRLGLSGECVAGGGVEDQLRRRSMNEAARICDLTTQRLRLVGPCLPTPGVSGNFQDGCSVKRALSRLCSPPRGLLHHTPRCWPPVQHRARPTGTERGAGEGTSPASRGGPGSAHVVAVALHPDDDQAEPRPRVEPSVDDCKLGGASLHAYGSEGGEQESATRDGVHGRWGRQAGVGGGAIFQATVIVIWLHP